MKTITVLVAGVLLGGCASQYVLLTSQPSGAEVSLVRNLGGSETNWCRVATTPCTITPRPKYDPRVALVSFPSGRSVEIDLAPVQHQGMRSGSLGMPVGFSGMVVGAIGNSMAWVSGGAGIALLGVLADWNSCSYTNSTFHVVDPKMLSNEAPEDTARKFADPQR